MKAGDGKTYKLSLVKEDDGYDPGRTPAVVKKLVEQDGIFAMVGQIGTETSLAVRQYMNDNCVPSIALATGSPEWNDAAKYPWYISGLPSYATEAHAFMDYLAKTKPDATIAVLYQSDDFGKSYDAAIKKYVKDNGDKMKVVAEQSYDPASGQTTEGVTTQLAQSKADVFFVGIGGTPCPQTLKFIPADWKPMTYVSITCSGQLALSLAGGADQGVYSTQATFDPSDPTDKATPAVQQFYTDGAGTGSVQRRAQGRHRVGRLGIRFDLHAGSEAHQARDPRRPDEHHVLVQGPELRVAASGGQAVAPTGPRIPGCSRACASCTASDDGWEESSPVKDYNGKSISFTGVSDILHGLSDQRLSGPDRETQADLPVGTSTNMIEPTETARRFLDDGHETPFLVVDLEVVAEKYRRLRAALPDATLHYAVKANPAPEILSLLVGLGARFDVASPAEIDMCVAAGADPAAAVVREHDQAAHRCRGGPSAGCAALRRGL